MALNFFSSLFIVVFNKVLISGETKFHYGTEISALCSSHRLCFCTAVAHHHPGSPAIVFRCLPRRVVDNTRAATTLTGFHFLCTFLLLLLTSSLRVFQIKKLPLYPVSIWASLICRPCSSIPIPSPTHHRCLFLLLHSRRFRPPRHPKKNLRNLSSSLDRVANFSFSFLPLRKDCETRRRVDGLCRTDKFVTAV